MESSQSSNCSQSGGGFAVLLEIVLMGFVSLAENPGDRNQVIARRPVGNPAA
jgi:hypothetical protein